MLHKKPSAGALLSNPMLKIESPSVGILLDTVTGGRVREIPR